MRGIKHGTPKRGTRRWSSPISSIYSCLIKVIKIYLCLVAKAWFHLKKKKKQWVAAPVIYNKCLSIRSIFKTWQIQKGRKRKTNWLCEHDVNEVKNQTTLQEHYTGLAFRAENRQNKSHSSGQKTGFTVVNGALHLALWHWMARHEERTVI